MSSNTRLASPKNITASANTLTTGSKSARILCAAFWNASKCLSWNTPHHMTNSRSNNTNTPTALTQHHDTLTHSLDIIVWKPFHDPRAN